MPTTRFASTAVKTATLPSSSEASASPIESTQEMRTKAFQARKQRDMPSDLAPKHKVMIQFIENLINVDKKHFLWTKQTDASISIGSIMERVYKGKFKDFKSLRSELNTLLSNITQNMNQTQEDLNAFKELYALTNDSLALEASRIKEELPPLDDNALEFVSLFRPTNDGYAFTDMIIKYTSKGSETDYPQNVHELIIHPTLPAEKDQIPTLKNIVAPPPKYHSKLPKHETKPVLPIQWLDFGAFSSFAPASDSNNANATYESTYMGRSAKRFKKWEQQELEKPEEPIDEEKNAAWLAKEGIDLESILNHKEPNTVSEELERNSQLLDELVSYQQSRFSAGHTKWNAVNEKEIEIAKTLEKSMSNMLSKLPPGATTNTEVIESTMERLPLLESAYRGTLPPHKIFSFPTTERAETLPPYANITPTYTKENWRLVKVTPLPPKEMTGNDYPVYPIVSMLEQQQLNFYQQKPPPVQQPQPQRMPLANGAPSYMYQQQQQQRR